jgi:hypothetical protein
VCISGGALRSSDRTCPGVAQDRAERLVDLVGDGGGELADRAQARGVGQLGPLALRVELGLPPPPRLDEQGDDQSRLHDEHQDHHGDVVPYCSQKDGARNTEVLWPRARRDVILPPAP